jgi:DNA transformation protein
MTKAHSEYVMFLLDMLQIIGPVSAKRMFGGYGIFLHGLMFALVIEDVCYLKANADTITDFTSRGLLPFTYHKQGKLQQINYYQCPEEALEDEELMQQWANTAYAVARNAKK